MGECKPCSYECRGRLASLDVSAGPNVQKVSLRLQHFRKYRVQNGSVRYMKGESALFEIGGLVSTELQT